MRFRPIITPPFGAVAPPMRPRARAARHDRDPRFQAAAHDAHHLRGRPREDDEVGHALVVDEHVALVDETLIRGGDDPVTAHDLAEGV
jgi:hypothetical protein